MDYEGKDDYVLPHDNEAPPAPRFRGPTDIPYLVRWHLLNNEGLRNELWRDRDNVERLIDELTTDVVRYRTREDLEHQLLRLYDQWRAARAAAATHSQAAVDQVVFGAKVILLQYVYRQKYGSDLDLEGADVPAESLYSNWDELSSERQQLLLQLRRGQYDHVGSDERQETVTDSVHPPETTQDPPRTLPRMFDISVILSENTWAWPGDQAFSRQWTGDMRQGEEGEVLGARVSALTLSSHTGTHVDAPLHVGEGTTDVLQLPLETLVGQCHVATLAAMPIIGPEDLLSLPFALSGVQRLIIHTGAGDAIRETGAFGDDYPALDPDAAQLLVDNNLLLFGIDAPSVDSIETEDLPNHHILARGGVTMLEGLCLEGVEDGVYELIALPLPIRGGDGSPVRAVLRQQ